jgi:anti-sigma factor RsiW
MATEDQIQLVHAYLDGELDAANALAMRAQIGADPRLAAELAASEALRAAIQKKFPPEPVPESLRRRVAAIATAGRWVRPTWGSLAAAVMLAVFLSGGSTWFATRHGAGPGIEAEIVDSHIRSLIAGKPTEVTSSDRHQVKPWFNGRLPQAPRVVDLSNAGFPLQGARIDVIARTPVPTLVFTRRLHVISLVALPDALIRRSAPSTSSEGGYNSVSWSDGPIRYVATSDLNTQELADFAQLFRDAPRS